MAQIRRERENNTGYGITAVMEGGDLIEKVVQYTTPPLPSLHSSPHHHANGHPTMLNFALNSLIVMSFAMLKNSHREQQRHGSSPSALTWCRYVHRRVQATSLWQTEFFLPLELQPWHHVEEMVWIPKVMMISIHLIGPMKAMASASLSKTCFSSPLSSAITAP